MTRYMLDTNTARAALCGATGLDERLRCLDPGDWCISAITRAEMRFGVAKKPGATRLARCVEAFLAATRTEPWNDWAADHHGRIRARLESLGANFGDFDEMVAAHAMALDVVLVTDNTRHFERVEGLRIENWIHPS